MTRKGSLRELSRTGSPTLQATAAPQATPVGKNTTVRCSECQHIQVEPASASTFQCKNCDAKLTRKKS